ncbi:hypothetical protein CEXT_73661 [Caerostris extrusa]|uniref:Uncharacterized protein n=1 Tax=Caerostris extrusa TaxID=172846 RepID=A0AAV4VUL2_CAEEX|nr:hypothetical protein CEXT_73661 [Caerostris extrusa]
MNGSLTVLYQTRITGIKWQGRYLVRGVTRWSGMTSPSFLVGVFKRGHINRGSCLKSSFWEDDASSLQWPADSLYRCKW